jgi:hypothetical protein
MKYCYSTDGGERYTGQFDDAGAAAGSDECEIDGDGDCRQGRDCPHKRDRLDFALGHVLSFLGGIGFVSTAFLLGFWRIWK